VLLIRNERLQRPPLGARRLDDLRAQRPPRRATWRRARSRHAPVVQASATRTGQPPVVATFQWCAVATPRRSRPQPALGPRRHHRRRPRLRPCIFASSRRPSQAPVSVHRVKRAAQAQTRTIRRRRVRARHWSLVPSFDDPTSDATTTASARADVIFAISAPDDTRGRQLLAVLALTARGSGTLPFFDSCNTLATAAERICCSAGWGRVRGETARNDRLGLVGSTARRGHASSRTTATPPRWRAKLHERLLRFEYDASAQRLRDRAGSARRGPCSTTRPRRATCRPTTCATRTAAAGHRRLRADIGARTSAMRSRRRHGVRRLLATTRLSRDAWRRDRRSSALGQPTGSPAAQRHRRLLGDDGRIFTSRNATAYGEALYGIAPLDATCATARRRTARTRSIS
jgi:hypothetical protein